MKPKYTWGFSCLHWIRNFKDGITFFELSCNTDFFKADHNPKFVLLLVILNLKIFELEIYNINHLEEDDEDAPEEIEIPCPNCKEKIKVRIDS